MPPQEQSSPGIKWNEVTWYSQILAITLFVAVFGLGYYLGGLNPSPNTPPINDVEKKPTTTDTPPNLSSVSPSTESTGSSSVMTDVLPNYVFKDFSSLEEGSRQLYLEGLFTPTEIHLLFYRLENRNVSIQCWEKTMLCAWADIPTKKSDRHGHTYSPLYNPRTGYLTVTEWSESGVIAKGALGYFPDCEKDSCGLDLTLSVDLNTKAAHVTDRACWEGCAEDLYLLVGDGDGTHKTEADLPEPNVDQIHII